MKTQGGVDRIRFNDRSFKKLINSRGVEQMVMMEAYRMRARAGKNFHVSGFKGKYGGGRPVAVVACSNEQGRMEEAVNKRLGKAVMGK